MDDPVTPADVEASKQRLRRMSLALAATEDRLAATFEHLTATDGDADGHRRRFAEEARSYAEVQRRRAAGDDPPEE